MENSFDLIRQLLTSMVATLPKLLGCLVILILGYIISKIVASVIKTVISKAGVDKLGKKIEEVDFIRKNNIEIKISGILSRIIFYFMMLIFIVAATDVLGMPALSDLFKNMLNYIPNVVVAGVLLLVGILVAALGAPADAEIGGEAMARRGFPDRPADKGDAGAQPRSRSRL